MLRMKANPAFTLIELLVVISIIAILIAILLPTLSKAKRAAKVLHCMSNFKQLGIGLKVYTNENNHRYPPAPIGPVLGCYDGGHKPGGVAGAEFKWEMPAKLMTGDASDGVAL